MWAAGSLHSLFLGRDYQKIWDNTARQRAPELSSDRIQPRAAQSTAMDPFSHIKIVHRQREEELGDDAGSPQMVFRRPSFSQQVQHAAVPGLQPGVGVRGGGGSSRASLANLTSGTTFAAAARQAELNAARASRQKAKEAEKLEKANEVPAIEPVALGTLKFTTSRRGYVVF